MNGLNLKKMKVISDGTNNFTTSGISFVLKIPSNINDEHTFWLPDKYWLSVSTEYNTKVLSKIAMVKTNGISATWKPHKAGEEMGEINTS